MAKTRSLKVDQPKRHWEMQYDSKAKRDKSIGTDFQPKRSSDRMVTHNKVNKTDT